MNKKINKILEYKIFNKNIILKPIVKRNLTKSFISALNNKTINQYLAGRKKIQTKKRILKYYYERIKNCDLYYSINVKKKIKTEFIGTITLRQAKNKKFYLGNLIFKKKYWGSLFSKSAFNIFIDFCFNYSKVNTIYAGTEKKNLSSNFNLKWNNFVIFNKSKRYFFFRLKKSDFKRKFKYRVIKL